MASGPGPGAGYVAPPVDPALLARTVDSVLAALDSVAISVIESKARKVIDDPAAVRDVAQAVKLSPGNRELIATNVPIVFQKHGINSDYMPEMALCAGLAGYGSGFMVAVQKLDALIKAKEAKDAGSQPAPAK